MSGMADTVSASRYVNFTRAEWARLAAATPLTLNEADLAAMRGINDRVSLDEVAQVHLPLSRLLNLYVAASQNLFRVTDTFLGQPAAKVPYVVGISGSVAVGKSTTARILQALLARWPDHPSVDLIATDGFLYPNHVLEARGLMKRKGFPESFDVRRLLRFLSDVKAGRTDVAAPVYSHLSYDIVPGETQFVHRPEIVIIEGLSLLQTIDGRPGRAPSEFVSDYLDFAIYVDAHEEHIERWYVERFLALRETVFRDPSSYFHRYASLSIDEARDVARQIWREINALNLRENIQPTRERSHLILEKGADHSVERVRLRKI